MARVFLSARNCSALKNSPQVPHRHFAFELAGLLLAVRGRPTSLGRNAMTSSPPQARHVLFAIFMIDITERPNSLVTIDHSPRLAHFFRENAGI